MSFLAEPDAKPDNWSAKCELHGGPHDGVDLWEKPTDTIVYKEAAHVWVSIENVGSVDLPAWRHHYEAADGAPDSSGHRASDDV